MKVYEHSIQYNDIFSKRFSQLNNPVQGQMESCHTITSVKPAENRTLAFGENLITRTASE